MRQVSVLLCVIGLCYGGLVKREADADAEPIYGAYGAGLANHGVAVGPVETATQCHTEVDVVTSEACNTITEQVCNTVTDTVTDYV